MYRLENLNDRDLGKICKKYNIDTSKGGDKKELIRQHASYLAHTQNQEGGGWLRDKASDMQRKATNLGQATAMSVQNTWKNKGLPTLSRDKDVKQLLKEKKEGKKEEYKTNVNKLACEHRVKDIEIKLERMSKKMEKYIKDTNFNEKLEDCKKYNVELGEYHQAFYDAMKTIQSSYVHTDATVTDVIDPSLKEEKEVLVQ